MENSLEKIFVENLRFYRTRGRLSQEKLSALLDKNINYINMIEGGKSIPPLAMIEKIAEILNIEPYYFLIPHKETEAFNKNKFIDDASKLIEKDARKILSSLFEKNT